MSNTSTRSEDKHIFYGLLNEESNNFDKDDLKYIGSRISLEELGLLERVKNALVKNGIDSLNDLINLTGREIYAINNLGPKSVKHVDDCLISYIENNKKSGVSSMQIGVSGDAIVPNNILDIRGHGDLLAEILNHLSDDRLKRIIIKRYGLSDGEKFTLEEIGKDEGLTRERVRQLTAKALRRLAPSNTLFRIILRENVNNWLVSRKGIVDEDEADERFIKIAGFDKYDGSSVLDLMSEMAIISRARRKSMVVYSPKIQDLGLEKILSSLENILFKSARALSIEDVCERLNLSGELCIQYQPSLAISSTVFLEKLFKLMPTINRVFEDGRELFALHSNRKYFPQNWSDLIYKVIKGEDGPLHFTEIAERVNNLKIFNSELAVRRALAVLIDDERFAHVGARGTYGLTEWGIRKERLPELIKECLKKAGFPLHFDQIFYYVSKYKYTKKINVRACLDNNTYFYRQNNGLYWLKDNV